MDISGERSDDPRRIGASCAVPPLEATDGELLAALYGSVGNLAGWSGFIEALARPLVAELEVIRSPPCR